MKRIICIKDNNSPLQKWFLFANYIALLMHIQKLKQKVDYHLVKKISEVKVK